MEKIRKYGQLFWVMFYLSAFTFGGGYVIVSLMQKEFVEKKKWISKDEMLDLIAIGPGALCAIAMRSSISSLLIHFFFSTNSFCIKDTMYVPPHAR